MLSGCPERSDGCGNSQYCHYTTTPFDPTNPSDINVRDDGTEDGDYWVFCDLQQTMAPIVLAPQLECGAVVAETAAATGTVQGTWVVSFPFTVADATPNLTFSTCGSRHSGDRVQGRRSTSLRLLKPMPNGGYKEVIRCDNCGDCGGSAALGFYPYNATHLRPHFNPAVFDLGLMAGIAPMAAGFCTSGERQQFENGLPTGQPGSSNENSRVMLAGFHNLSSCAGNSTVLVSYGWTIETNCLRDLSETCRCWYYNSSFLRPGIISLAGSVLDDEDVGGQPEEDFWVYCEAEKNVGAWERDAWLHPWVDAQLCRTGSARRFRAGYPASNEIRIRGELTAAECLGNVSNLAARGSPVYAWGMWNEELVPQRTCTDTVASGAEDAAGNTCSDYVDYTCVGAATDLSTITSPFNATTVGASERYYSTCGGTGGERIFFVALEPGGTISIRQMNSCLNEGNTDCAGFDSVHETRWGGGCPGDNLVQCTDDPDSLVHSWTNDQNTTEMVYFVVNSYAPSGAGAGVEDPEDFRRNFTLEWNVTSPGTVPASTGCTAHVDGDFDAEDSCCACGGGTVSFVPSGHRASCYYYDEPFLAHAPENFNIFDEADDSTGDFWVYCETDENIGAVSGRVIAAGEYIIQLETARWNATEGDAFRLEMACDTRGPTAAPTVLPSVSPPINRIDRDVSTDSSGAAVILPVIILFCVGAIVMGALYRRGIAANKERHRLEACGEASVENDPKAVASYNPGFVPPVAQRALQAAKPASAACATPVNAFDRPQATMDSDINGGATRANARPNSYLAPQPTDPSATYETAVPVYDSVPNSPVGEAERPNSYLLPQTGNSARVDRHTYQDPNAPDFGGPIDPASEMYLELATASNSPEAVVNTPSPPPAKTSAPRAPITRTGRKASLSLSPRGESVVDLDCEPNATSTSAPVYTPSDAAQRNLLIHYEDEDNMSSRPASSIYSTADRKSTMFTMYAEPEYAEVDYSATEDADTAGDGDDAVYEIPVAVSRLPTDLPTNASVKDFNGPPGRSQTCWTRPGDTGDHDYECNS